MNARLGFLLVVFAAACSEPCVEMRELTVMEKYPGGADTIGFFRIRVVDEASGPDYAGWHISALQTNDLTAVHLHARRVPNLPVSEILSFPIVSGEHFLEHWGEYDLPISIDELMSALSDTSAYLDFHTPSRPQGMMRTRINVITERPWGRHCF